MTIDNFNINAEIYDLQVNWEKRLSREKDFFANLVKKSKAASILDIGCGTGHHARFFSTLVPEVVAADPAADMIEYARKNTPGSKNITFIVEGLEKLDKIKPGPFDLVTCLGNTLAIIGTRKKVKKALKNTAKKLSPGGTAVFQFLNYNYEMLEANRYYPPKVFEKDGKAYSFVKHFEYGKTKTRVDFIITVFNGPELEGFFVNTSYLCTLKAALFKKIALNAGFKDVKFLGPDGRSPFDAKKHISLYAICGKKPGPKTNSAKNKRKK